MHAKKLKTKKPKKLGWEKLITYVQKQMNYNSIQYNKLI